MVEGKTTVSAPIGGPSSPFPQRVGRYELLLPLGTHLSLVLGHYFGMRDRLINRMLPGRTTRP